MLASLPVASLNHNPRFMGIPDSAFPENALAARIKVVEGIGSRAANLQAVKRIESWLKISIASHQTVGVENSSLDGKIPQASEGGKEA